MAAVPALLLCAGCGAKETEPAKTQKVSLVGYHLDTVITLTAYADDEQVLRDAMGECERLENLLSRTVEGSDVWKINHAGGEAVEVSEETAEVIACALEVGKLSGGAFDLTVAPVSVLWDFRSGAAVLPDAGEIEKAAALVDYTKVKLDGRKVTIPAGMMIDLGGIAKGYIADKVKEYLVKRGVKHAILSFGGNVVAIGKKPDGSDWRVGIQDIDKPTGSYMLVARNSGGSTVTSGIYERGFELDGVRYHHLLSPKTGWPVQNGLASVTIFSDSSMWGDALATAAFVLGPEEGIRLIERVEGTEAVFIRKDRTTLYTSGTESYMIQ